MPNKISAIVLAGLLLVLLILAPNLGLLNFLGLVLGLVALTGFLNYSSLGFSWSHLLLPTFYLLSSSFVFAVISNISLRTAFLILAVIVFYFLEIRLGKESHFLQNIFLFSAFGFYLGLFALGFYLHLPSVLLVLAIFLLTFLLSVQGFAGFALSAKKYFYLLISLVIAEAAWGLSFWPTHFLVNAVVEFCLFYALWLFAVSAFFGKLSIKKIYWQLILVLLVLTITLASATWRPLV